MLKSLGCELAVLGFCEIIVVFESLLFSEFVDIVRLSCTIDSDWSLLGFVIVLHLSCKLLWGYNFKILVKLLYCLLIDGLLAIIKRLSLIANLYLSVALSRIFGVCY